MATRTRPPTLGSSTPDAAFALVPGLPDPDARRLAARATSDAIRRAPKLSGGSASRMRPYWGEGFYGVQWEDPYVWFITNGTRARVMRSLAGKTIPMWIDDPTGDMRRKNPKAETRVTADGRRQVLIFRRAARIGQRKLASRRVRGQLTSVDVPASYPGAPGRIGNRTEDGRITSPRSGGVRWRHPGVAPNSFIQRAILDTALHAGLGSPQVHVARRG